MNSYLEDASGFKGHADHVYVPENEAELTAILAEASANKTPVTVAGAGTGITGGRVPFGGIVVSLELFRNITIQEGSAIVGAGVLLRELQAQASAAGNSTLQIQPKYPLRSVARLQRMLRDRAAFFMGTHAVTCSQYA